jgi:hypothetical protein
MVVGGGLTALGRPREGASSSDSELTTWWVYWWISLSFRIIWRLGKGRTPNLEGGHRAGWQQKEMDVEKRYGGRYRQTTLTTAIHCAHVISNIIKEQSMEEEGLGTR